MSQIDSTDSFDLIEESDEISKVQNLNQKLNIEICNLQSLNQTLEIENKNLKEEIESYKIKINNYEEYIQSLDGEKKETNNEDLNDINYLKTKYLEYQKEIERLNEFISEELIQSENMQNDYENQIQSLRSDCEDLENENEQLKIDINNLRTKCQREVQEIFNEMTQSKNEKEQMEEFYKKQNEELQSIIKKMENKIYAQDKLYNELNENSTKTLKETIDKYNHDIKEIQKKTSVIDSLSSKNEIDKINETNHQLKTENIQLKADLNKYKNDLNLIQNEFNRAISKKDEKEKTISEYKAKIESLEEKNEQLKTDLLNFAIGETSQVNNLNNKEMITPNEDFDEIIKEKKEIEKELEKYKTLNLQFNKTFCFKLKKENQILKEEILNLKKIKHIIPLSSRGNIKDFKRMQNSIDQRKTTKPKENFLLNGIKEKNSNDNITPDGNINLASSVNLVNEYSEISNNKLIQFLREQNKSYQNDIQSLTKGKNELMDKIKEIEKEKVKIKEQVISKEREVSKYRIMINRLELKLKELSNNKNNVNNI